MVMDGDGLGIRVTSDGDVCIYKHDSIKLIVFS